MTAPRRPHLRLGLFGFAFGATLSAAGFSDYGEIHRMFTFTEWRLLLAFAGAVLLAGIGFKLHCPPGSMPARPLRSGTVVGGILFGLGWALCGGCPGAALVMVGEGKLAALLTLAGIVVGARLGQRVKGALRWDTGSCAT